MVNVKKRGDSADRRNKGKAKVEKRQRRGEENDICNHKFDRSYLMAALVFAIN